MVTVFTVGKLATRMSGRGNKHIHWASWTWWFMLVIPATQGKGWEDCDLRPVQAKS
jgi:hypothetical protein